MLSDDFVISVRNLCKTYRLFSHPSDRIKQFLSLGTRQYHRAFTALSDVSFNIKRGETIGIIGRNGSGKSTLLQLICGILKPTSGLVQVHGRISALLELGAGFNPEFTGRENVYFQGALMGFTQAQMAQRFDDIVTFADIGEFIDQPVRVYSSGMFVRLAFAVAVHMEPDILVVDEALGVGDALFQAKCFERIRALQKQGASILLVTHNLEQVAHFCDTALYLEKGKVQAFGPAAATLDVYLGKPRLRDAPSFPDAFSMHPLFNPAEVRWGDGAAKITDVVLRQAGQLNPATFLPGLEIRLTFTVVFQTEVVHPVYGLTLKTPAGAQLFSTNTLCQGAGVTAATYQESDKIKICFRFQPFLDAGPYLISLGVVSQTEQGLVPHDRRYDAIHLQIVHPRTPTGDFDMSGHFELEDV